MMERFKEVGVNTEFREPSAGSTSKASTLSESYYPTLFGDDGLEDVKRELKKRIEKETKAEKIRDVEDVITGSDNSLLTSTTSTVIPAEPTDGNKVTRWKWAFKDTSNGKCFLISP